MIPSIFMFVGGMIMVAGGVLGTYLQYTKRQEITLFGAVWKPWSATEVGNIVWPFIVTAAAVRSWQAAELSGNWVTIIFALAVMCALNSFTTVRLRRSLLARQALLETSMDRLKKVLDQYEEFVEATQRSRTTYEKALSDQKALIEQLQREEEGRVEQPKH